MGNIKEEILSKLEQVEEEFHVKILHAVESGSRSWGVESPDSDYDVRFIYVRPQSDYLKLNPMKDIIEWQLDEVFDVNGWDLRKALQQFHRGNATLFEWSNSPVVYKTTGEWQRIYQVAKEYFSEKVALYHYYGTARSTFEGFLKQDAVKYKKYIYALRPILSCRYIEEHHSIPPVLFGKLLEQELPEAVHGEIRRLLEVKARTEESELNPPLPQIQKFLENELGRLEEKCKEIPDDRKAEWEALNEIFFQTLQDGI